MADGPEIEPATLIAVLTGEGGDDDRRRVMEWRAADPEHEERFRRLERVWATLEARPTEGARPPSAEVIVEMAGDDLLVRSRSSRRGRSAG
jgi:ferric-dicitrate binding protein FerR (iron transport regulator)